MGQSELFVRRLERLGDGERARLRSMAGQSLEKCATAFDLFTGLWWPLRQRNAGAPRRETSWLVAKLHSAFAIPHVSRGDGSAPTLARALGRCEQRSRLGSDAARRHRDRFDRLLQAPLRSLEPHLMWALSVVDEAVAAGRCDGVDWARLLDDLSIWDRGEEHRGDETRYRRDVREVWAEEYLSAVQPQKGERSRAY